MSAFIDFIAIMGVGGITLAIIGWALSLLTPGGSVGYWRKFTEPEPPRHKSHRHYTPDQGWHKHEWALDMNACEADAVANPQPRALYCNTPIKGRHVHYTAEAVIDCQASEPHPSVNWPRVGKLEDELGLPRSPEAEPPRKGHRVTDGRTGEVVGYWNPK